MVAKRSKKDHIPRNGKKPLEVNLLEKVFMAVYIILN